MTLSHNIVYYAMVVCIITVTEGESTPDAAQRETTSEETESVSTTTTIDRCRIEVQTGKNFFHSELLTKEPHFVQFKIKQVENENHSSTANVFEPFRWTWTYKGSKGPFPFISWSIDYGILSFHMLETKTIYLEQEIELNVSSECNITYGTKETVEKIVNAFVPLINVSADEDLPKYTESYFCYYQINSYYLNNHIISHLIYNLGIVEYKCAVVSYNHTRMSKHFVVKSVCKDCIQKDSEWRKASLFPYGFSILALLYCSPIIVFSVANWLAKHEKIIANEVDEEYERIGDSLNIVNLEPDTEDDWLYADGVNYPLTVSDVFGFLTRSLATNYPVFLGRLRRFSFVLLVPSFIYLQLLTYAQGMGKWKDGMVTVKSLVDRRAPMGFLSWLGDPEKRQYSFAYWLGGPVGVTSLYFALSFLFIVLPRSMKQIIEDGVPSSKSTFKSPLFLTFCQTIRFSNVTNRYCTIPGYTKAIVVIKCRFYMLFSAPFWQYVWTTQSTRWSDFCSGSSGIWKLLALPLYPAFCVVEICCCLIYYAFPFCSFITILVNGATKSLSYLQRQNRILGFFFSFRFSFMFVLIVFTIYTYIISLVFVNSLLFVCQIISFCFVAVIMYPSDSFGYLFFFTLIVYYLIELIQRFSDGYMELLTTAVDLSRHVEANEDYVCNTDGHLNIVNMKTNHIVDVTINGKLLDVSQDILRSLETVNAIKVREKNGVYGIPKILFDTLVEKFRPVHRELLSICFNAAVVTVFVAALLTVSGNCVTGPVSEVMHVLFIVVVGALSKILSSVLFHSHGMLIREIEEQQMKDVIITYWQGVDNEMA